MTSFLDTLAERGIKADFAPGFTLDLEPADPALESEAVETAKNADVVLMFLGLPEAAESEGFDRDTLDMPAKQIALLEQVAARTRTSWSCCPTAPSSPWPRGPRTPRAFSNPVCSARPAALRSPM